jgi:hypothetical protein
LGVLLDVNDRANVRSSGEKTMSRTVAKNCAGGTTRDPGGTPHDAITTLARIYRVAPAALSISALCLVPAEVLRAQERAVEGLWGSVVETPDHPSWRIEEQLWFGPGAPRVGYEQLRALVSDPANDGRPLAELAAEARETTQRHVEQLFLSPPSRPPDPLDPRIQCEPPSAWQILTNGPRPFSIDVDGDQVVFHHEVENTIRRIPLRERTHAGGPPSRMGTAVARFEGDTLVIETTGIAPMSLLLGAVSTDALRIVERYVPDENDPNRLEAELILDDPGTFREPLVFVSPRVRIEGEIFVGDWCEPMYEEVEQ